MNPDQHSDARAAKAIANAVAVAMAQTAVWHWARPLHFVPRADHGEILAELAVVIGRRPTMTHRNAGTSWRHQLRQPGLTDLGSVEPTCSA
jgi:hypothetical protein